MSEPARDEQVVDLAEYLEATIARMDGAILNMQADRTELAIRLAGIRAASDPTVLAAAAAHEAGTDYSDARDANEVIGELHRRYGGR